LIQGKKHIKALLDDQSHDYVPDFIIRLKSDSDKACYLILETKGFDPTKGVKSAAA